MYFNNRQNKKVTLSHLLVPFKMKDNQFIFIHFQNWFKLESMSGYNFIWAEINITFVSYLLSQVHGTQLGRLGLGIHHDVEHGADGLWHTEVCAPAAPLKFSLKRSPCPSEKKRNIQGHSRDFKNTQGCSWVVVPQQWNTETVMCLIWVKSSQIKM